MDQPSNEFTAGSVRAALAAAFGAFVSIGPIVASTFGIFLSAFTHQFGWSRAAFSVAVLICALVGAVVTPLAGRVVDRFGVRAVMLPAVALFGLAMMGVMLVQGQIWQLYACYAAVGVTAGFQNMVAYSKVVSVWFHRHRGLVLSLVSTCYGVGYAIMPKVVQPLIATHGWRFGYLCLGSIVLASLLVLVPFLRLPEQESSRGSCDLNDGRRPSHFDSQGLTPGQAAHRPAFWILLLVLVLGVTSLIGTVAHLFPMLLDRGYSARFATTTLSLFALGGIIGQLSYGALVDRVNSPKVALPFFVASLLGLAALRYGASDNVLLIGAAFMGIGQGSELGLTAYFAGRYFGLRHLGEIYGYLYAAATVASGIGPVLMGFAYDRSHSYALMLQVFVLALGIAVLGVASLGPYVFAVRRSREPETANGVTLKPRAP